MKNLSTRNEPLELSLGKQYYIIDALYLNDIKSEFLKANVLPKDIRNEFFPYTDTPFALYKASKSIFSINQIKKVDYDDIILEDLSFFSTDTGLIVFLREDLLVDFLKEFNYDDLVNSDDELISEKYWKELISNFESTDFGLVLADMDSENDFDGSGTYKVV